MIEKDPKYEVFERYRKARKRAVSFGVLLFISPVWAYLLGGIFTLFTGNANSLSAMIGALEVAGVADMVLFVACIYCWVSARTIRIDELGGVRSK